MASASARTRGAALEQALAALENYLSLVEPGSLLPSERTLSKHFGVSRTTLRSAIAELAVKGRLEIRHGTGTVLLSPPRAADLRGAPAAHRASPPRDWLEICHLVLAPLAGLAARRATPDLHEALDRAASRTAEEFHEELAAATGNAAAPELLAWLREGVAESMVVAVPERSVGRERLHVDLRRAVVSAIAVGDAAAAEGAMAVYLETYLSPVRPP